MENILNRIIGECKGANKYAAIAQAATEARDAVLVQQGNPITKICILREKCLTAIENALESHNSRMVPLGLEGLQFMLRDNQLHSLDTDEESHEQTLPTQVVHTLSNLPSWKDEPDLQCHCLTYGVIRFSYANFSHCKKRKALVTWGTPDVRVTIKRATITQIQRILLQLTSSSAWSVDSRVICDIVELCISTFGATENLSVRMAARATVIQTISSYCGGLCKGLTKPKSDGQYEAAFADVEILLSYCCGKLKTILSSPESSPPLLLMLDAICSVLGTQGEPIRECEKLMELIWKELCPLLITILGNPTQIDAAHSRAGSAGAAGGILGRGLASASGEQVIFGAPEVARAAQNICVELLRIMGPLPGMRSILEALYHRMLIFPPADKRLEALRTLRRVTDTPSVFFHLCVTEPVVADVANIMNSDLNLWKICLDCLVECSTTSSIEISVNAAKCALSVVRSLETISTNDSYLSDLSVERVNKLWPSVKHAVGPAFAYSHLGQQEDDAAAKLPKRRDSDSPKKPSTPEKRRATLPIQELTVSDLATNSAQNEQSASTVSKSISDDELPPTSPAVQSPVAKSMNAVADKIASVLADSSTEAEESMRVYYGKIRDVWEKQLHIRPGHPPLKRCDSYVEREALAAGEFVNLLCTCLVEWASVKSTIELDAAIQEFAVSCSEDFMTKQLELLREKNSTYAIAVYNVDAIYLLCYASLRLLLQQHKSSYFSSREKTAPMSTGAFVDEVLSTGNITFASSAFVTSVYEILMKENVLAQCNIDLVRSSILADLCRDYDGSDGDFLSDFLRLDRNTNRKTSTARSMAMSKICRRILTASWDGLSKIFCKMVDRGNETGIFKALVNVINKNLGKQDRQLLAEGVACSLEALRRLALLCRNLGLEENCIWIFHKLVEASCPLEDLRRSIMEAQEASSRSLPAKLLRPRHRWSLHLPHALSMEVILDSAIAIASCALNCWTSTIRCCEYIFELEHWMFADSNQSRPSGISKSAARHSTEAKGAEMPDDDDDFIIHLIKSPVRSSECVADAIGDTTHDSKNRTGDGHALSYESGAKALCVLSGKAERIFDEASRCLNLYALKEFVKALIAASQSDLFYGGTVIYARLPPWSLLQRLGTLIMKLAKSGRPFSHLMHIWGIAAPHFVEASCCKNGVIANRAVSCLHDVITAVIGSHFDLKNFYFNEALLQAYSAILCLDISSNETQDQIVGAIAELVSTHKEEIYFGWKALFAALRAVRYPSCADTAENAEHTRRLHTATVDIFVNFMSPGDLVVFGLAADDCLSTLLYLLNEPASFEETNDPDNGDASLPPKSLECDFGQTALAFLKQYNELLASLYVSADRSDVFVHFLRRFVSRTHLDQLINRNLINMDLGSLPTLATMLAEETVFDDSMDAFYLEQRCEEEPPACPWAQLPIEQQLVCEALAGMVEGLVSSVAKCPRHLQPLVVEVLHDVIVALLRVPGRSFCTYCLNHLVLPMLQNWLRREALSSELMTSSNTTASECTSSTPDWRENSPTVRNFKQCLGLTVDAVVDVIRTAPNEPCCKLLFAQTLDLLVECIAQPSEVIGRLGCASLRHVVTSLENILERELWDVLCRCLWRIGAVTLFPLRLLISYFRTGSRCYFGDVGRVEVALRKDSNPVESSRLRTLAQQVFLLDNQKYEENLEDHPDMLSQSCRSIVFVLHPPYSLGEDVVKLPFRNIVVSLLTHQLWLQMIGYLLVNGTSAKLCGVASTLTRHVMTGASFVFGRKKALPGCLSKMTSEHVKSLLLCLDASMTTSHAFDGRPGLKFLVQKIFSSPVPANLYKMAVTSWTLKLLALYELASLCIDENLTAKRVSEICGDVKKRADRLPEPPAPASAFADPLFYLQFMFRAYMTMCCRCCELLEKMDERRGETDADSLAKRPLMLLASEYQDGSGHGPDGNEDGSGDQSNLIRDAAVVKDVGSCSASSASSVEDIEGAVAKNSDDVAAEIGPKEKVYSLASNDTVNHVLSEYKRTKQRTSLPPNRHRTDRRANPFNQRQMVATEPVAEEQQAFGREVDEATMKDGEASRLAWSEMAASLMELILRLPNDKFKIMLPCIYPALIIMTARSNLPRVRNVMADLLFRLPEIYGFMD